jgi:hypothetical protein
MPGQDGDEATGLDSYASRTPGDVVLTDDERQAFAAAGVELCGGIESGDDGSSFRGKVYLDVVDRVADVSLMELWIPPDEVRAIADAFEACDPAQVADASAHDHYPASEGEIVSLRRFFAVCAERGLGLIGWW